MRRAIDIAAALLCLAGASLALVRGFAERNLVSDRPEAALALGSDDWRTAMARAARDYEAGRLPAATQSAAHAVNAMPMRPEPITLMALIAQREGRYQAAGEMVAAIGLLGWRYPGAQLLILESARRQGNAAAAILRADALLRQNAAPPETLFPIMRDLAHRPDGLGMLVDRLSAAPNWRWSFLEGLVAIRPADYPVHLAVLNALRSTEAPPTAKEIARFSQKLVADGRFADAERLGGASSDGGQAATRLDTGSPFDFTTANATGVTTEPMTDGRGFTVSTQGSAAGVVARRLALVSAGPHRLRATVGTDGGYARALRWSVECASAKIPVELGVAEARPGGVAIPLTIPEGCAVIRINLIIDHLGADAAQFTVKDVSIG
jgi:hypothetical protein